MTDNRQISESGADAAKLKELCNLVLHRADSDHEKIIDDTRREIALWIEKQQIMLDTECDRISHDAQRRADEIASRQIANARSESHRERLKLQSKCVDEARAVFQKELENLRERADYKEILAGLVFDAMEDIPKDQNISLRLSAADAGLGEGLTEMIKGIKPLNITFDPAPGEFNGGVMISSADGRWSVISDWRAKTDELSDVIATRVLAAL